MQNQSLVEDHLSRCQHRLAALQVLYERKSWADVVRESQEIVELALKALLRYCNIEVPRLHDVSDILLEQRKRLPKKLEEHCDRLCEISRDLRRDRELSFYGSEDLTPSQFYKESDAIRAKERAQWVAEILTTHLK